MAIAKLRGGIPGAVELVLDHEVVEFVTDGVFENASSTAIIGNSGLCGGIPQLKLPPCSSHDTKKPSLGLIIGISIGGSACLLGVFALFVFFIWKKKIEVNLQTSGTYEGYIC